MGVTKLLLGVHGNRSTAFATCLATLTTLNDKSNVRKEGFGLSVRIHTAHHRGEGRTDSRSMRCWSHGTHCQEGMSHFSSFIQSRTPLHGMMMPTFRLALSTATHPV